MLLKTKLSIALAGTVLAFGVSSTAQAQQYRSFPISGLNEQQVKSNQMKVRQYRQRYNYKHMVKGLELFKGNSGIQKCLRWSVYGDEKDPQMNPYIEKALHDIAKYGITFMRYNMKDIPSNPKPEEAFDFCRAIPKFPTSKLPKGKYNPDGSIKHQGGIQGGFR
jgi:hypothetical protein